jgi:two-component system, NtrC family, sensor kinase
MNFNKIIKLKWFYDLSIRRKQLVALLISEVISIVGLVGTGSILIISSGRNIIVNQAKSELAVTEINYNIKINQMGFGFRGQSDNLAIINAAKQYNKSQYLNPNLQQEVKKILQNEIKARQIEYATLVSTNLQIIANANQNRTGEIFNPKNLVTEVFRKPEQIKTSEIVTRQELIKENPDFARFITGEEFLIRYTVTPVKDPQTGKVIAALLSGDIVNQKLPIVSQTLDSHGGGYSAVYLQSSQGEFELATSAFETNNSNLSQTEKDQYLLNIPLPNTSLLKNVVTANNK